jgi:hypothetical protein
MEWPVYKPMPIVNYDSRVVNKLKTSLTGNARVVIYDHHLFIVQATERRRQSIFIELTRGRNLLTTSYLKTALQQTKLQQGRKILQPYGVTVLGFCVMLLIHP